MSGPGSTATAVTIEVSPGELIDKITILEIKAERIEDAAKLGNVLAELEILQSARATGIADDPELDRLTEALGQVNRTLWEVEDALRDCEHAGEFGPRFVELARSVYLTNDRRSALKREINLLLGSRLVEEKSYKPY